MEPRKGGMVPYVPKPLERISETAIVEHKPTGLPVRVHPCESNTRGLVSAVAAVHRPCACRAFLLLHLCSACTSCC